MSIVDVHCTFNPLWPGDANTTLSQNTYEDLALDGRHFPQTSVS